MKKVYAVKETFWSPNGDFLNEVHLFHTKTLAKNKVDSLKEEYKMILEDFSDRASKKDPYVKKKGYDYFEIRNEDYDYCLIIEIVCKEFNSKVESVQVVKETYTGDEFVNEVYIYDSNTLSEEKFDSLKQKYKDMLDDFSEEDTDFDSSIDPMVENRGYDYFQIKSNEYWYNLILEIVYKKIQ